LHAPDGNFEPLEPVLEWNMQTTLLDSAAASGGSVNISTKVEGDERRTQRGQQCGAVYIFRRNTTTFQWRQEAKLLPDNPTAAASFGYSVAIDGNTTVVGSPGENDETGVAYIFEYDTALQRWSRKQRLTSFNYDAVSHQGRRFLSEKGDRFGCSTAISGDTVVVGALGTNNSEGAAYVFTRKPNLLYHLSQRLHIDDSKAKDAFGVSVAIDTHSIVVGAYTHDTAFYDHFAGIQKGERALVDVGAAYTFYRLNVESFFYYEQKLLASDMHEWDRFGTSVSITGNTVVVGAHELYTGALNPRRGVQEITTSASAQVSGYFRVLWKRVQEENIWDYQSSRAFKHDITSDEMKEFLEADLQTEELLVERSNPDSVGGYTWTVTFVGLQGAMPEVEVEPDDEHPLLGGGSEALVSITARVTNQVMPKMRGNAYLFTREFAGGTWIEQAALVPKSKQYTEVFGVAAAAHYETAVVGCPNRDTFVSDLNGGAAFTFDLGFLNVKFSSKKYRIQEGNTVSVQILRCRGTGHCHTGTNISKMEEIVNFDTGDVVSTDGDNLLSLTKLINNGYKGLNQLTMPYGVGNYFAEQQLWLHPRQVSTAVERAQYYGSTEKRSIFVNTQFDFVGVSDFAPQSSEVVFNKLEGSHSVSVLTTDDAILEEPDEIAMIRLSLPGIWPTYGGHLWSTLIIEDDGDGMTTSPLRSYTSKVYASEEPRLVEEWPADSVKDSGFGFASAIDASRSISIVGAPDKVMGSNYTNNSAFYNTISAVGLKTGAAYIYELKLGVWAQQAQLLYEGQLKSGSKFGESVDIDGYLDKEIRAIVGAPGIASAFIFRQVVNCTQYDSTVCVNMTTTWVQEAILTAPGVNKIEDRFGAANAVAIHGDYAVVGAPGVEAIFIYQRNSSDGNSVWTVPIKMVSSDFDYDQILGVDNLHRPGFGCSVDLSVRTIAVGAERGDYGNSGTPMNTGLYGSGIETYETDGQDPNYFGRGKVYVFYVQPQSQTVVLRNHETADELNAGTFRLQLTHRNTTLNSTQISYKATHTEVKHALQNMSNIDNVTVTRIGSNVLGYTWTLTFFSEVEELPKLEVLWNGYGCSDCTAFSSIYPVASEQMEVSKLVPLGLWKEVWSLQAPDRNNDDKFGSSLALSQHQLVVGAYGSSSLTTTSWNFETGDLTGWRKTGTAFDYQPTYGDNTIARSVYDGMEQAREQTIESYGFGQPSRLEGRYFIGTYEKRPGRGHTYTQREDGFNLAHFPDDHRAEFYKDPGPDPPGTTQGDGPQGTLTSQPFVINGTTITFKVGGGCNVGGDYWNPLTEHIGGGVYVELLVEGLSVVKTTGRCKETMHFESWSVASYQGRTAQIRIVDASSSNWGHINVDDIRFDWDVVPEVTPNSGAVYVFRRHWQGGLEPCTGNSSWWPPEDQCQYEMQAKVQASDKRAFDEFGHAVAVSDETGVLAVAARNQMALNQYKEAKPGVNNTGDVVMEEVGAVYLYRRVEERRDGLGNLMAPPYWSSYEDARVMAQDHAARDHFGASVALSQYSLLVGATGDDGKGLNGGAVIQNDVEFLELRFRQRVFAAMESNVDKRVEVSILRGGDTSKPMTVSYTTSDLTAKGVDTARYEACQNQAIEDRRLVCGDYEQTAGDLYFDAGLSAKSFFVRVMDDACYEHRMEFLQVTLRVPGGGALLGQGYNALVRIDDDDYTSDPCTT